MQRTKSGNGRIGRILGLLFILSFSFSANATGLQNSGFEQGETGWTITADDAYAIVGTEDNNSSPVYTDFNVTVKPFGNNMLRLGSLPQSSSSQTTKGLNTATQTFRPTSDTQLVSFWMFSDDHRSVDTLTLSVKDTSGKTDFQVSNPDGGAVTFSMPTSSQSCTTTPCVIAANSGKQGNLVNTGWVRVLISGLPTDKDVTITYTLSTANNSGLGTWVYADSGNNPPYSLFEVSKTNTTEGNIIRLVDKSYEKDPGDQLYGNKWEIYSPICNCTKTYLNAWVITVQLPDEGTVNASLTVYDKFGDSDTSSSGGVARDNTYIPAINYINGKVYLGALNYEALPGSQIELRTRILDAGWGDHPVVSWSINDGTISDENVTLNQVPVILTGLATAKMSVPTTPGTVTGSVTVDDLDGSVETADFSVTVIDPQSLETDAGRREPNNTIENAKSLESGSVYLSTIHEEGDVDLFRIVSNGAALKHGSSLLLKLKELPQDYDIAVLRKVHPDISTTDPFLFTSYARLDPFLFTSYARLSGADVDNYGSLDPFLFTSYARLDPFLFTSYARLEPYLFTSYARLDPLLFTSYARLDPYLFTSYARLALFTGEENGDYPTVEAALQNSTIRATWLREPLVDPFGSIGLTFDQFPLSDMDIDIGDDKKISQRDVDFSELGLGNLADQGLELVAFSANRGLADETVLVNVDGDANDLIVAVVGVNGSYSPAPYSLQIETNNPMDVATYVGEACNGEPLVANSSNSVNILHNAGTNALFVTQADRYSKLYGADKWGELNSKLAELADMVGGTVISVPSAIYDAWDTEPCSVEQANMVTEAIRNVILAYRTDTTEYVTLVGNDKVMPFHRAPDATIVSSERTYVTTSNARPGTASHTSLFTAQNLTDDYYADGRERVTLDNVSTYVPQWTTSRLVESPDEVIANINAFIANNGQLDFNSALVTGYDIFFDSADAISLALGDSTNVSELIDTEWTAEDLACQILGDSAGEGCVKHDAVSLNAHAAHFMAQSSNSHTHKAIDFFFSIEVAAAGTGEGEFSGKMFFANGCHAAYNMPDGEAINGGGQLDFAQAMTRQGAVYIGNTGYGLAGINTIAGTEELLLIFSEELLRNPTVGLAFKKAKQRYLATRRDANDITAYTEKSSSIATLYGLPMYTLSASGVTALFGTTANQNVAGVYYGTSQLTVSDQGNVSNADMELSTVSTNFGEYFVINGSHQTTATRPVQPKYTIELPEGEPTHDVLLLGGTYSDINGYDPVYYSPVIETSSTSNATESLYCQEGFWPSRVATVNTLGKAIPASLVAVPAQFFCENNSSGTGTQRVYTSMEVEVLRSAIHDNVAPNIKNVDLRTSQSNTTEVVIDAVDSQSGVARIVILLYENGTITPLDSQVSNNGPYIIDLGVDLGEQVESRKIVIQVADAAGNVSIWTGKSRNIRIIPVYLADNGLISEFSPTLLTSTISNFNDLMIAAESMSFFWEFGDSHVQVGTIRRSGNPVPDIVIDHASELTSVPEIVINQDGSATFSIEHQYMADGDVTARLKLKDSDGGIGSDSTYLTLCGDPDEFSAIDPDGDMVACDIKKSGTQLTVLVKVADAGSITNTFQYRLHFDYKGKGKSTVPDGNVDLTLKYDNGSFTSSSGLKSLNVQTLPDGKTVEYTFDLGELGWTGTPLQWHVETQSGVEAQKGTGFADRMPDAGVFYY